jgi:hypothetical protein
VTAGVIGNVHLDERLDLAMLTVGGGVLRLR